MDTMQAPPGERPPLFPDANFDVVAIAASAGGLKALEAVLGGLPADFPAAVLVVQHLDPRHRSLMAEILSRHTRLQVLQGEHGCRVEAGHVYIAPPDFHMLITPAARLELAHSELVRFLRPSADLLFESAAGAFRDRAVAVVLTGTGKDGSSGIQAIKQTGGTVIAQDEATSEFYGMPGAAAATGTVDFVLPLPEIPGALTALVVKRESP